MASANGITTNQSTPHSSTQSPSRSYQSRFTEHIDSDDERVVAEYPSERSSPRHQAPSTAQTTPEHPCIIQRDLTSLPDNKAPPTKVPLRHVLAAAAKKFKAQHLRSVEQPEENVCTVEEFLALAKVPLRSDSNSEDPSKKKNHAIAISAEATVKEPSGEGKPDVKPLPGDSHHGLGSWAGGESDQYYHPETFREWEQFVENFDAVGLRERRAGKRARESRSEGKSRSLVTGEHVEFSTKDSDRRLVDTPGISRQPARADDSRQRRPGQSRNFMDRLERRLDATGGPPGEHTSSQQKYKVIQGYILEAMEDELSHTIDD